jgi:two-component system, NtrC family, C4-dicarboxylate transport response regulator DctD
LPADILKELAGKPAPPEKMIPDLSYAERMDAYESDIIRQALRENGGSQSRAARALRMPVQTLHNKMVRLKIELPPD